MAEHQKEEEEDEAYWAELDQALISQEDTLDVGVSVSVIDTPIIFKEEEVPIEEPEYLEENPRPLEENEFEEVTEEVVKKNS